MSEQQQHTPEPWYADARGSIWRRHPSELYENGGGVAGDYPVARAFRGGANWENGFPFEANARRIVACVNALSGFKTEDLERLNGVMFGTKEYLIQVMGQRDALLAALMPFAKFACELAPGETCDCHNCNARAAIAFAGGEL